MSPPCRSEEGEEDAAEDGGSDAAASGPALSFWSVASALTATVKARTVEVLTAVHDTDWRSELEAFQQVGAGPLGACCILGGPCTALLRRSTML